MSCSKQWRSDGVLSETRGNRMGSRNIISFNFTIISLNLEEASNLTLSLDFYKSTMILERIYIYIYPHNLKGANGLI